MPKTKIQISEILASHKRETEVNDLILNDIDFVDDSGNVLEIDPVVIEHFSLTGLNIFDFIATGFYKQGFKNVNYPHP